MGNFILEPMKNIFRVPVDNQHFKDTIETGKPVGEVANFLLGEQRARLQRIAKEGVIRYWGSIPGEANTRNFERLNEGDELICYRSGRYIALAKVAFTTISRNLAKNSWGETEIGKTWELIYFFSDVKFFEIDSGIVNEEFGFKDGPVMGFNAISEDKAKKFLSKYGSVENFIKNLGFEEKLKATISEEISKLKLNSPHEAQFCLVDLGNQLEFNTYVPPSDAGHKAFGKKLEELITVHQQDLVDYIAPVVFDQLSHIDVIWFKDNYQPQFFYEVVHKSGWSEALLRLDSVKKHYEFAKARIIAERESEKDFKKALRLWSGPRDNLLFRDYDQLIHTHDETLHFRKVVEEFLG